MKPGRPKQGLLTFAEVLETFDLRPGRLRGWIHAGVIKPVARQGRGRGKGLLFTRGSVAEVLFGICPKCGAGFRRDTLKQNYCSRSCRDRARWLRLKGGET